MRISDWSSDVCSSDLLVEPAAGSIRFSGCEIGALSRGEMKRVRHDMAMMFQDPRGSLSPRLAVRQLITEPYRIHDLKRRDLDEEFRRLLGLVGLPAQLRPEERRGWTECGRTC